MRSVAEHQARILDGIEPLETIDESLLDALGQTLARDVVADVAVEDVVGSLMVAPQQVPGRHEQIESF